jgi:hypothetical protein
MIYAEVVELIPSEVGIIIVSMSFDDRTVVVLREQPSAIKR